MTQNSILAPAMALRSILEAERELLMAGNAAGTIDLMDDKLEAMKAFEGFVASGEGESFSQEDRAAIESVIQMATENAAHFEAIRNGLESIISRLGQLDSDSYVGAYGEQPFHFLALRKLFDASLDRSCPSTRLLFYARCCVP